MRSTRALFSTLLALALATAACSDDSVSPSQPGGQEDQDQQPGSVTTSGPIRSLGGTTSGLTVVAGLNTGEISGTSYSIDLNENAVQMVSVVNEQGQPVLLSVALVGTTSSQLAIDARSTAATLVFLNPFLVTSDAGEAAEALALVQALPSFNALVAEIDRQLAAGTFVVDAGNPALDSALSDVFFDLQEVFATAPGSPLGLEPARVDLDPGFAVNGLSVVDLAETADGVSFAVRNSRKRWISLYVDGSADGESYESTGPMVDLIPSPGIGVGELLRSLLSGTNPLDAFPERSDQVTMPFGSYSHLAVKAYGLGLGYNLPASEFSRAVLPAAASAVFDIALPGLEVITGFPLSPELRGRPTNHPFYALVVQTAEDIVSDARTVDRMYRWYREGDLVAIAVDVVWLVTQQMADNPRLVGDLITQIVGEHIARTAVSSWLFPIRVAHGVLTSVNVGVSLASVLSSEVVTTFVLTDDLVEDDLVQVTGLIRDASLPPAQAAIGGATVTFFDENDNQVSVTITGSDGIFVADVPAGETRLRVVAEGFRAVNQFADVEPDAQSTFVFPTILMAPYAAEPGGVRGTVRSAVNLSPLSDAAVTVRYGVNNPDEEILGVATTSVTGAFELTGLPAGTHTAYVTMDGFVTEAVPVAIVAGAVLEGLTVSMVPEGLLGLGYRIVLTWGQDPRDLDSHLYTPVIEGRTYHVYYASRGSLVSAPYANLDVDDVTSFGPETITIQQVFPGEYSYSVYKFSGLGDLAGSGANVALYGPQGFIREWTVPLSGSGRWWNVFTLDGTTGAITGVNTVTNSPAGLPFATASAASGPKPVASN